MNKRVMMNKVDAVMQVLPRRKKNVTARLALTLIFAGFFQNALAAYPEKAIYFIVPFAPGGPVDATMRLVGNAMSKSVGKSVVVDYKAGANSIIGTEHVAKSAPDGYTILVMTPSLAINAALMDKLPYDSLNDFAPITMLATTPFMLTAHPALPANTIKELIAFGKSKPGYLNFAVGGAPSQMTAELFRSLADMKVTFVPYKGAGPAFADLVAGQVHLLFSSSVGSLPFIKSGRLKALSVTGLQRTFVAPDVPTVAESGFPGFEASSWFGLMAPAKTAKPIVDKLQQEVAAALKTPEVMSILATQGADAGGMKPEEFGAYFRGEFEKWGKVIRTSGIKF